MMNTEQLKLIPTSAPLARRRRTVRVERSVPRRSPLALTINRFLDVSIAGLALAVLALPMLALAALVKLTSHGPAFYRQQRVGLNGRTFVIYKLRTMVVDAEAKTGPIWARHGDPRCTMLGHVLRRWCLDEIPQFLNVLRGEMSLVGPRPERPCFVQEFSHRIPAYHLRHQVRPGITGWAQINGWRGDSSLDMRIAYDLFYVRNWSVWFNLRIMLLTPLKILVDQNGC